MLRKITVLMILLNGGILRSFDCGSSDDCGSPTSPKVKEIVGVMAAPIANYSWMATIGEDLFGLVSPAAARFQEKINKEQEVLRKNRERRLSDSKKQQEILKKQQKLVMQQDKFEKQRLVNLKELKLQKDLAMQQGYRYLIEWCKLPELFTGSKTSNREINRMVQKYVNEHFDLNDEASRK